MKTLTSFKTLLSMLVMLFAGMTAQADNKVYIDDFSIATTDGEVEIALNLTNDATDIRGLEGTITLPAGLTISNDGYGTNQRTKADDTRAAGFMQNFTPSTGLIKLRGIMSANVIAGNEGAVLYVKVKADETLARTSIIKLSNFTIEHSNGTKEAASVADAVVTRTDAPAATDAMIAVPAEVNLKAGGTAEVTVELENETAVTGFELKVQLPAGVTAEAAKEARLTGPVFNYNKEIGQIVYWGPAAISGNSGAIFKLTLTADETFTADAKLLLTNIVVTNTSAASINLDPVVVTLKTFDADAEAAEKAALQQAIDDLKATIAAVSDEAKACEDATVKTAVEAANTAIADAEAAIAAAEAALAAAEGKLTTDDAAKKAVEDAIEAAKPTVDAAKTAVEAAEAAYQAYVAEAAAEAAAQQALADAQGKATELMAEYQTIASYNHPDFFGVRNQAAGMLQSLSRGALQNLVNTVHYACNVNHNAATDGAEGIAAAIEQFNTQYEAAKAAIEAAKAKKAELEAAEAAARETAQNDVTALQETAAGLVIPEELLNSEDPEIQAAVAQAGQAIVAANGTVNAVASILNDPSVYLSSEAGATKFADAKAAAEAAIAAAKAAIDAAIAKDEALKAELAAEAAAQQALADAQGKATELMAEYQTIASYNHPDFFGVRNQAAGMLQSLSRGALQNLVNTVHYACNVNHNAATDGAEGIAAAIEQFNTQYEAAKAAIEAAKAKKAELEAAEAAARETAQNDVTALQETAAGLVIPEELLNSEDPEIQAAVAQAGQAIVAANGTVNAVASILNDPSVYLSSEAGATKFADAKAAAEAAIAAAKAAIEAAIEKDEALKAELAAQAVVQETLDGLTEDLQKLMDDYNKLLSYGNPAIDALVHGTDTDMTRANEAYAAADEMVAQAIEEGNVATDNALAVKAALDMASLRIADFAESLKALEPQLAAIEQQAAAEAQAYAAEAMGRLQQLMGKMNGLYYGHPDYQETYNALYALRGAAAGLMNPLMMGTQTAVGNGTVSTENYQNLKQTRESMEAALVAFENGIAAAEALKAELEEAEALAIEADNVAVDALETEVADAAEQITDEMRASNNAEVDAALTVADAAKDAAVEAIAAAQAVVDDANVWKSSEEGTQQFAEALEAAQAAVDAYEQAVEAVKVAYENATGISTVSVKKYDEGAWYTLNGQRVETPSKGVFIHNGKKVVIK